MLIANWMNANPLKVSPGVSMMRAGKLLKDAGLRELSVVDDNDKVIGVLTDRDIKEASPSKATTLDVHELYYLLSEIKVEDIMTKDVLTITPQDTVERAAVIMKDKKIGVLPVVDSDDKLVGSITHEDVFNCLVEITGVLHGGLQVGISLPNDPGSLQEALSLALSKNARIMSVLTSYASDQDNRRNVFLRFRNMDKDHERALLDALKEKYEVLYSARDAMHPSVSE